MRRHQAERAFARALHDFKLRKDKVLDVALEKDDAGMIRKEYHELDAMELEGATLMVWARMLKMQRGWK